MGVLFGAALIGLYCLGQAIYILRNRRFPRWGMADSHERASLSRAGALRFAGVYVCGAAFASAVILLALHAWKPHVTLSAALTYLTRVWQMLLVGIVFCTVGVRTIRNPASLLRAAKSAHPEINENDPSAQGFARLLGAAALVGGLVVLVIGLS